MGVFSKEARRSRRTRAFSLWMADTPMVAVRELHTGRRAGETQPEPVEIPGRHPTQRWEATALVYKAMTGKAEGRVVERHKLEAATREDVLSLRAA